MSNCEWKAGAPAAADVAGQTRAGAPRAGVLILVQAALAADGQPVLRIDGSTPAKRRGQARQTRACRSHHAGPAARACRRRCISSACAAGAWQWLTMSRRLCHPRPRLCAPGAARVCEPGAWRPGGAAAQPQGRRRGPQPDRRVARAPAGAVLEPCQCARASAAARSALLAGATAPAYAATGHAGGPS